MKLKVNEKIWLIIISFAYILFAYFCYSSFWSPLVPNAGEETLAYTFENTGKNLAEDAVSVGLCKGFAFVFGVIILSTALIYIYSLIHEAQKDKRFLRYFYFVGLLNIFTILVVICLYPLPISLSPDTFHNFVYVKSWLPMYWHGFLTNVIYCAELLIIPHPVSMTLVPALFATNIFCSLFRSFIKTKGKAEIVILLLLLFVLVIAPETSQIWLFVGRNYMYGILSITFICLLLMDYIHGNYISVKKMIVYAFLCGIIATWRSEGIVWLVGYPLLFAVAFCSKKNEQFEWKKFFVGMGIFVLFFCVFNVPGKYGSEKYQGEDYFIMNLPGPLTAVLKHPEANLSYAGADDDLRKIDEVIPMSFLDKYGYDASSVYNYENGRISRQCMAGEKGKEMVVASYRLLFHNFDLYLKYQINVFLQCLYLSPIFDDVIIDTDSPMSDAAMEGMNKMHSLYSAGEKEINRYPLVSQSYKISRLQTLYSKYLSAAYELAKYWKLFVPITFLGLWIHSVTKREWTFSIIMGINLGIIAIVVLTVPTVRNNYFFYPYFNMYWIMASYLLKCIGHKKIA